MDYKLNEIFEIYESDSEQVIIKVKADSPLKVARFPFVSMDYAYITVTRGVDHTLTIVKTDGRTFSFDWGRNGYTLIGDELTRLKNSVIEFTEANGILLGWSSEKPQRAVIYYNSNFHKWQLTIEGRKGSATYWSKTAESFEEMVEECERLFVKSDFWERRVAVTGISVWEAFVPEFIFK